MSKYANGARMKAITDIHTHTRGVYLHIEIHIEVNITWLRPRLVLGSTTSTIIIK